MLKGVSKLLTHSAIPLKRTESQCFRVDRSVFLFRNQTGRHMLLMNIKAYSTLVDRLQFHVLDSSCKMYVEMARTCFESTCGCPAPVALLPCALYRSNPGCDAKQWVSLADWVQATYSLARPRPRQLPLYHLSSSGVPRTSRHER